MCYHKIPNQFFNVEQQRMTPYKYKIYLKKCRQDNECVFLSDEYNTKDYKLKS